MIYIYRQINTIIDVYRVCVYKQTHKCILSLFQLCRCDIEANSEKIIDASVGVGDINGIQ